MTKPQVDAQLPTAQLLHVQVRGATISPRKTNGTPDHWTRRHASSTLIASTSNTKQPKLAPEPLRRQRARGLEVRLISRPRELDAGQSVKTHMGMGSSHHQTAWGSHLSKNCFQVVQAKNFGDCQVPGALLCARG